MSRLHEQVTWLKVKRLQAILAALVSDEPDSKFDAEIVKWRKCVVATVKRNVSADAQAKLDAVLHVLSRAGRCDSKTSVLEDAGGDPVQAIALLDMALDDARQAEWKCCTRNAWGDGEHDVTCPYAKVQAKIAELERRLKLAGYYGDDARRAEFAEVERRIEEVEARAAGYAQRICNARRELDRTFTPPHGDGG